ncbi:hypothetical protein JCM3774_000976 [Rhodotorula dairenensis]
MHLEHPPPCPPVCDHCLAFDSVARALCSRAPSPGSKWCELHEELQAKLLKSYKRLTCVYEAFDDGTLPANLDMVATEKSLDTLRAWSEAARSKWLSARRVITARAEHHQQFYGGGDFGHARYVASVSQEQQRMEVYLRALEQRAYTVTLERSAASWALGLATATVMVCDDAPKKALDSSTDSAETGRLASRTAAKCPPKHLKLKSRSLKRHPNGPPAPASKQEAPGPLPVDHDAAFFASLAPPPAPECDPRDLLRQLRGYLEPPLDLPDTVAPFRWITFVEAVFRIVILRVPALAMLALAPAAAAPEGTTTVRRCGCSAGPILCSDRLASSQSPPATVVEFLDVLEGQLGTRPQKGEAGAEAVVSLWRALKYAKNTSSTGRESEQCGLVDVGLLVSAIDAVLLGDERASTGDGSSWMDLLGGRVWKDSPSTTWTRAEWDLFYQLVGCPGCSLIGTRSFRAWVTNRRLALLGRYRDWSTDTTDAERIFRLSDVVLCTSNSCHAGKKVRRVEQKCVDCGKNGRPGKKVVYIEEWEASWIYIKLPADQGRSREILDYLASHPERYQVLARNVAEDAITHRPRSSRSDASCANTRCSCARSEMPLARVRSGLSPVERKTAKWTTTTVLPTNTILASLAESSSPETRFHSGPYQDVIEAVVLDASPYSSPTHDSWLAFADRVAQNLVEAQGYTCFEAMFADALAKAVACGDVDPGGSGRASLSREDPTNALESTSLRPRASTVANREPLARNIFREE